MLDVDSLTDAKAALKRREGVPLGWIGCWPSTSTTSAEQAVSAWAIERGFDGVVWTASPPKWNDTNGDAPTVAEAIAWLIALGDRQAPAREYIEKAPAAVRTPYREAFERELGWMPHDLA
jgi:hypothetical protein